MSRMSLATPCPAPLYTTRIPESRRLSTASWVSSQQDHTCTARIEYTRAINPAFAQAQPRRPQRKTGKNAGITLFEDVVEDQELVLDHAKALPGKTLLSKPARKLAGRVVSKVDGSTETAQPLGELVQARRRTAIAPPERSAQHEDAERRNEATGGLKKDPRRRTIFVPSDDTTMLTIHPGANTTDRLNDTFQFPVFAAQPSTAVPALPIKPAAQVHMPTRRPRMSLTVAPKRLPLRHLSARTNNLPSTDVPGQNGGKENVPPGGEVLETFDEKPTKKVSERPVIHKSQPEARTKLYEPTASSQARQSVVVRKAVPLAKTQARALQPTVTQQKKLQHKRAAPARAISEARPVIRQSPTHDQRSNAGAPRNPAGNASKRTTPPKLGLCHGASTAKLLQYPVLSEDVAQPQLYEESWLSHQEVALAELINGIFDNAQPSPYECQSPTRSLRERMLDLYHQPPVTTLHKRLQASLTYGALSRPKDMPSPPDPTQDLGLRKRFLNLWLNAYDEDALRAAAEVVIGRQLNGSIRCPSDGLEAGERVLDPAKGRRALIGFLETFLVTVEDIERVDSEHSEAGGVQGRRWGKTVLRSLMLIWLLDQAKATAVVSGCLFKRTAAHKSSTSVLYALSGLLIPSIGDLTRPLRHFEYAVDQVQDPLDEVTYRIDNIATNLRDGIFLTCLVEILLFSIRMTDDGDHELAGEATVTLQLPDATVIESALCNDNGSPCPRILSQHLRMPCFGRAEKLYNVQIALSALVEHGCSAIAVTDVSAEDVVDGHREKTLSLLWALVSCYGLEQLVDWEEITKDIERVGGGDAVSYADGPQERHEHLLKAWAAAYSVRTGIHIRNLTTTFADGKAYEAILDAFASFLPTVSGKQSSGTSGNNTSLKSRLRALGCSTAFIKQLTSSYSAIPSRTTTVSNLAFLASRLLPLARRHNAAMTIQRVLRRKLARRIVTQRVVLARLASACATVVQTQQRLVRAATVLQRSWRSVLVARLSTLNSDVEAFQVLARGWSVRRCHVRKAGARVFDNGQSLSGMRGW